MSFQVSKGRTDSDTENCTSGGASGGASTQIPNIGPANVVYESKGNPPAAEAGTQKNSPYDAFPIMASQVQVPTRVVCLVHQTNEWLPLHALSVHASVSLCLCLFLPLSRHVSSFSCLFFFMSLLLHVSLHASLSLCLTLCVPLCLRASVCSGLSVSMSLFISISRPFYLFISLR